MASPVLKNVRTKCDLNWMIILDVSINGSGICKLLIFCKFPEPTLIQKYGTLSLNEG